MHMLIWPKQKGIQEMKLPEALKHAVLTQDWQVICTVYTHLTGEPLEIPKPKEPDYANMEIDIPLSNGRVAHVVGKEIMNGIGEQVTTPPEDIVEANRKKFMEAPEADDEEIEALIKNIDDNIGKGEAIHQESQPPEDSEDFISVARTKDALDSEKFGRKERIIIAERDNRFNDNGKVLEEVKGIGPPPKPRAKKKSHMVKVECANCHKQGIVSPVLARGYDTDPDMNRYRCNDCLSSKGKTRG